MQEPEPARETCRTPRGDRLRTRVRGLRPRSTSSALEISNFAAATTGDLAQRCIGQKRCRSRELEFGFLARDELAPARTRGRLALAARSRGLLLAPNLGA